MRYLFSSLWLLLNLVAYIDARQAPATDAKDQIAYRSSRQLPISAPDSGCELNYIVSKSVADKTSALILRTFSVGHFHRVTIGETECLDRKGTVGIRPRWQLKPCKLLLETKCIDHLRLSTVV